MPAELARCQVAASQSSPLVTEWPASEKAHLEAMVRDGGVAVAYSGCSMRILPDCRLAGRYTWRRTTPAVDWIQIGNVDELYAKLPLGAASLEGELARSGTLAMQTTVSGQLRLEALDAAAVSATPECAAATHLVTGLAVGAFNLSAGGTLSASTSVDVTLGSATATTSSEKSLVRMAGDPERCYQATADAPDPDCSSPIQIFLTPLPGRAATGGPPGTIQVNFYAAEGDATWEVVSGKRLLCKTPCHAWLDPAVSIIMKRKKSWARDDRVTVPSLRYYAAAGTVSVRARSTARGLQATGTMVTVLSGAAIVAGVSFAGIDCWSDDPGGMCTAAKYTLPTGLVGLGVGIYLIRRSLARAEVTGDRPAPYAENGAGSLVVGPGYVAGSF